MVHISPPPSIELSKRKIENGETLLGYQSDDCFLLGVVLTSLKDILLPFWWVLRISHLTFDVAQQAHPNLIQAFQATATAGGSGSSDTFINKSLNVAIIGDNPPWGGGVDEKAARAAAEVRKKVVARGLLIRPHGVPVKAMPPLTQLLNIINLGMTLDAAEGRETDGVKKEANGHPSNGPVDSKNDELTSGQEDQAPVGLGTGLALLDAKKQKAKAKAAAWIVAQLRLCWSVKKPLIYLWDLEWF